MPLYEYMCTECDKITEKLQGYDASNRLICPSCQGEARRVISRNGFQLKGSGWYKDHYGLKPSE